MGTTKGIPKTVSPLNAGIHLEEKIPNFVNKTGTTMAQTWKVGICGFLLKREKNQD